MTHRVEQLESMLSDLIEELFGCTPAIDFEDPQPSQEGEEHVGESCEQAHPDASHEEWAEKRQKGES